MLSLKLPPGYDNNKPVLERTVSCLMNALRHTVQAAQLPGLPHALMP